ncbi:EAL domain-containing protein [Sporolactobacillus sp. STSJ-5]|uniref:EAL domain-containing protein n=1 Tax=Sporolactobacillus sp. STSJ-5 TaxID=2965076 RepID=UPI00210295CF|nr:EAL domain-containing protein [Sporolactobacillus sp. STSJ-5]MCQ2011160.1 EAL domain-containing protein [Sporolactobacillus sp. STSJ-5]
METSNLHFFSLLFMIVCIISVLLGTYVILKNAKDQLNRIFFTVCICLCIWSFGFSISVIAPSSTICLFWRRFSAIGWGTFYGALLHFCFILTGNQRILKKVWMYPALYLPAALTVYVFGLSAPMAAAQYQFIKRDGLWVNLAVNNGWDFFFYSYFTVFLVAGLLMLWHWRKHATTKDEQHQAKVIFGGYVVVSILGTFTDLINNSFDFLPVPQMAPILFMLFIASICYCIRKYRLMSNPTIDEAEIILNEENRTKMYDLSSMVLVLCGIVYFVCQFLLSKNESFVSSFETGLLLIGLGVSLFICNRRHTNRSDMEAIYTIIASLIIPIFIIKLAGNTSSVIFAIPFVTIIGSLVFNQRMMLTAISLSSFLTQIYVWISAQSLHLTLRSDVYISRLTILAAGVIFAFYVNRIYILRLKQNSEQMRVQKFASKISANFVTVSRLNVEEKMDNILKAIGEFFDIDHVSLNLSVAEYNFMDPENSSFWNKKNPNQIVHGFATYSQEWVKQFGENSIIHISNREKLPREAEVIRQELEKKGIQSVLSVPITVHNVAIGHLKLESTKTSNDWNINWMSLLEIVANIFADALVKVTAEKRIHFMAYFDELTGLPNRLLFGERVKRAMSHAESTGNKIAIVFLDLDSFKDVNDTLGHEAGDLLIKKVTGQLSHCISPADTVSRFGGDEFLIMLNHISEPEEAIRTIDKIMKLFHTSFMLREQEVFVTASAGVALYPDDGDDTETLVKSADTAMYEAKSKGKNQYALCTKEMKDRLQMRLRLMSSLFHALPRNELSIVYQPQVCLKTEQVVGVEALLRWKHTELGNISPGVFIELAEQTGLINPIGEWVLKSACTQLKKWLDKGIPAVRVAVNLSVVQLRNPLLVNQVKKVLDETGIDPELLELEITESATTKDFEYIVRVLNDLKALGVSLSIDDFGTKYSSLGRLKKLPVDRLKMDMQFIQDIGYSAKGTGITKAIINLAKYLDLQLIAEGVENQVQLEFLRTWSCDLVQGYYYYRPLSSSDLEKVMNSDSHSGNKLL